MMMWNKNTGQPLRSHSDVLKTAERLSVETTARQDAGTGSGSPQPAAQVDTDLANASTVVPTTGVPVIPGNEGSPEGVAYKLFLHIVAMERVSLAPGHGYWQHDRRWVLSTYVDCLKAVKHGIVE